MNCRRANHLLLEYSEDAPFERRGDLAAHLEACAGCRARLAQLRANRQALGALPGGVSPAGLADRALSHWLAEGRRRLGSSHPRPWLRNAPVWAGGAAAVALAATAWLIVARPEGQKGRPAAVTANAPGVREARPGPTGPAIASATPGPPGGEHPPDAPAAAAPSGERKRGRASGPVRVARPRRATMGPPRLPRAAPSPSPAVAVADDHYLNQVDPRLTLYWMTGTLADRQVSRWLGRRLPRFRDDFVEVSSPALAAGAGAGTSAALRHYQAEARVVDARLFKKVTLQLKGASLEGLCAQLQAATGARIRAARGLGDEKVTVLVRDRPARDVMRAVTRLLGTRWLRTGEEGAYRYELFQDLSTELAEEEMRGRDVNAALLALDREMERYRPLIGKTPADLKQRLLTAGGEERRRLEGLVEHGGWGGLQLYARLSPAERMTLRSGGELRFDLDAADPARRLPEEWKQPLLESWNIGVNLGTTNGREFWAGRTPLVDCPGAVPSVRLRTNRSELGELRLEARLEVDIPASERETKGNATGVGLALGRSPSAEQPENGRANEAVRRQPPFTTRVTLQPHPVCALNPPRMPDLAIEDAPEGKPVALTSAQVWEEVHRRTGLPIVADFYTRLHPAAAFSVSAPLFDALNQTAGRVGARWKKDGDFLLARSTTYFWDKLKEVPNRQLLRWRQDRAEQGGLPLDDLLEIAQLTDQQLDSRVVAEGVIHYWRVPEWSLLGAGGNSMRPPARLLAALDPEQLRRILGSDGLPGPALTPPQRQQLLAIAPPLPSEAGSRAGRNWFQALKLYALYCPAGWYWWAPRDRNGAVQVRETMLVGRSRDDVLAAARRIDPAAAAAQVRRSDGDLLVRGRVGDAVRFGQSRTHGFFHVADPEMGRLPLIR